MQIEILKLGTLVKETTTGRKGMLTHAEVNMEKRVDYLFQPRGINPETGGPVMGFFVSKLRITGGVYDYVDMPLEMLGTEVMDEASGVRGTVVSLVYHISGCVHAMVQPAGVSSKTGDVFSAQNFDVRRLSGKFVPKFTEAEVKADIKKKPSPAAIHSHPRHCV